MKLKTSCLFIAFSILASLSYQVGAVPIYSENFDDGVADGFTFEDLFTPNLWHVTSNFPASSPNALGYVQDETEPSAVADGNYNTGARNGGRAISPIIPIPSSGTTVLSVDTAVFLQEPNSFEYLSIFVRTAAVDTSIADTDGPFNNIPVNTGAYTALNFDLTALGFAGSNVQIGFEFDSSDGISNDAAGARVDNIVIDNSATIPEPSMFVIFGLGLGLLGVFAFRLRKA